MTSGGPRAAWFRRTAVATLLSGASVAYGVAGPSPLVAGLAGALGVGWLLRQGIAAARDPALGLFLPAVGRAVHPGRVALLFRGLPTPGRVAFGCTCFVTTPDEAAEVLRRGWEPALAARGPVRRDALATPIRWVDLPFLRPGLDLDGLRLVGPAHTADHPAEAPAVAAAACGTDLVRLPLLPPAALDALLDAWAARGIRATSLSDALLPEAVEPAPSYGRIHTTVPGETTP